MVGEDGAAGMSDLVARLRCSPLGFFTPDIYKEAADEIERLQAAVDSIERLQAVVDAARNLFTKNAWMERERLLADVRDKFRALDGEL